MLHVMKIKRVEAAVNFSAERGAAVWLVMQQKAASHSRGFPGQALGVGPFHSQRQMLGLDSAINSHRNENSRGPRPTHTYSHTHAHALTHQKHYRCVSAYTHEQQKYTRTVGMTPTKHENQTVGDGKEPWMSQGWIHDLIMMCSLEKWVTFTHAHTDTQTHTHALGHPC